MSNVLFLPMPGHGHVNPTLAVAAQLVARGHDVTYLLPESFRHAVTGTGARFVPLEGDLDIGPPPAGGMPAFGLLIQKLLAVAEAAAAPLLDLYDRIKPDLVVGETMSLWSSLLTAARSANLVHLSPSYVMGPSSPMRERMAARYGAAAGRPPIDVARLGAVAQLFGLQVTDPMALMWRRDVPLTVAFLPAEFHPRAETLGDTVHFVGPALGRAEQVKGIALPAGPLLYVSLGTVFNDRRAFFVACLEAFGGGELPVVINHGSRLGPADFPDVAGGVLLAPHVPQLQVLSRSAAFVTHGGMGSTMEALAAGVPLVVVPQMIEQEITADRVAELGLGVRLDPAEVTPARLRDAVATVTGDPSYRAAAEKMGRAARDAGGATAAADLLEAAVG